MDSTFFDTLIITGGLAPSSFQMKGWKYSKIIAADSGYDTAKELGIIPDEVVGDFDSTRNRDEIIRLGYIPMPHDKDQTDTELALMEKEGVFDIIGGGGGRLDHLFSILVLYRCYGIPRYWFTDSDVLMGFEEGECYLDSEVGTDLSIMPVGTEAHVTSDGLVWELGSRPLSLEFISQSNRSRNERVYLTSDAPVLIRVSPESFKPGMLHLL